MSDNKSVDIRGLLDNYEFPCKLPGSGRELSIKPITTGQMKKILVYEEETDASKVEDALDKLIMDCVLTEGFDVKKIYLQDRFYLLLEIRKVSKGSSYSFNFKCPKCDVENTMVLSLDSLKVTEKTASDGLIEVNDKLKFEVDFPTREQQEAAFGVFIDRDDLNARQKEAEIITATFANCIKRVHTPDGVYDDIPFDQKMYILDNMPTEKFENFKDWFTENEFGVDFKVNVGCRNCDFREESRIPLSDFFV